MIPTIGIMIAFYIMTKMFSLIVDKRKETSIITLMFGVITIVISIYAIITLFTSGTEIATKFLK